jgi:UDP-N-acetylmuramate dehydrogenase
MMAAERSPAVTGEIRHHEPMSHHTSWRAGGPAEIFYRPEDLDGLAQFLQSLDTAVPVFWFGLGSNLLVRDGGLRGAVISASGLFTSIEKTGALSVSAGASVPCTQLARQCIRWGFGPSEFFAGIPGLLGGALAMNAGAHGNETWERVRSVTTIDRYGEVRKRLPQEYEIAYRNVRVPEDEWFIAA